MLYGFVRIHVLITVVQLLVTDSRQRGTLLQPTIFLTSPLLQHIYPTHLELV